ncbi:MAG: capsular polysaccharide biosynthesis protein CapF, partial [Hungatella sp.]
LPSLEEQSFEKKLYATYISYLPQEDLLYPLMTHMDERGSFTELIRTMTGGQFSVNITRPGITKGGHWHHTKTEKFVVVSGRARIQLKKIVANADGQSDAAIDYHVSGEKIEVVDIPPGYLHAITNEGDRDLITLMWCDECFDQEKPDTFCR